MPTICLVEDLKYFENYHNATQGHKVTKCSGKDSALMDVLSAELPQTSNVLKMQYLQSPIKQEYACTLLQVLSIVKHYCNENKLADQCVSFK